MEANRAGAARRTGRTTSLFVKGYKLEMSMLSNGSSHALAVCAFGMRQVAD